jgi:hypothetical protein
VPFFGYFLRASKKVTMKLNVELLKNRRNGIESVTNTILDPLNREEPFFYMSYTPFVAKRLAIQRRM